MMFITPATNNIIKECLWHFLPNPLNLRYDFSSKKIAAFIDTILSGGYLNMAPAMDEHEYLEGGKHQVWVLRHLERGIVGCCYVRILEIFQLFGPLKRKCDVISLHVNGSPEETQIFLASLMKHYYKTGIKRFQLYSQEHTFIAFQALGFNAGKKHHNALKSFNETQVEGMAPMYFNFDYQPWGKKFISNKFRFVIRKKWKETIPAKAPAIFPCNHAILKAVLAQKNWQLSLASASIFFGITDLSLCRRYPTGRAYFFQSILSDGDVSLDEGHFYTIVLHDKDSPHALACCHFNITKDAKAEIISLKVDNNHQKKGIGNILMIAIIEFCAQKEIREFFLESVSDAVAFYTKMGFMPSASKLKYSTLIPLIFDAKAKQCKAALDKTLTRLCPPALEKPVVISEEQEEQKTRKGGEQGESRKERQQGKEKQTEEEKETIFSKKIPTFRAYFGCSSCVAILFTATASSVTYTVPVSTQLTIGLTVLASGLALIGLITAIMAVDLWRRGEIGASISMLPDRLDSCWRTCSGGDYSGYKRTM